MYNTKNAVFGKSFLYKYVQHKYLTLLFFVGLTYIIIFKYLPIYGLQIAFKDYKFLLGIWDSPWVGFENFKDLLMAPSFSQVFKNTVILSIYNLIAGFPAPIVLAILLNEVRSVLFKKTVQTISYLPHFISWVILGGMFIQFLSPSIGPINIVLKSLGMKPIFFLGDPDYFRGVAVFTHVWKSVGWGSIVYLAALSGIDSELYQAADIDGANRLKKMINITLPGLTPVITIMLIFDMGKLINDHFDQIFNLYNPAVYSVGDVISTYTYRMGIVEMKYSFSTAVGLFKNIISFTLVVIANSVARKINEYSLW